jgi:uncharacterized protein (TIGR03503 family)
MSFKLSSKRRSLGELLLRQGHKHFVFMLTFISVLFSSVAFAETSTAKTPEAVADAVDASKGADIRMLIDISGSMKKNDPANLRIPAVNLLTELIPDGDEAGIWTFGQWVNNLVKRKAVDDEWRLNAKEKAQKINSVALYTNIGAVLEKASDDFYKEGADFSNTHFILLTDGMVDIDKDPEKNSVERERILSTVLDTFKSKGAKVHTISLSKNADRSLMDKLAIQTGGQSAVAESSEDLTRIFLQALEQAVPSEQVPLEGNEFVIDSSIEEFTALIFRGDGSIPTEILSPEEKTFSYENQGDDIKWYRDKGYDLITVKRPLEGTWRIKSDVQPGSQVTVVSNLQLNVTKLPVNFFAGDALDIEVSFVEEGKVITSPDFLNLLDVKLQLKTEANKTATKSMSDEVPEDGVYREAIRKLTKMGQYEITVLVDGKTFKRKKRQIINLRAPFDFEFSVRGEGEDAHYALVVTPMNTSISTADTNIFAKVNAPDGSSLINAVELSEDGSRWVLPIRPDKGDGLYRVAVKVKAQTHQGKKFKFKPKPFEAEFPIPAGAANNIVSVNEPEKEESEPEPELEEPPVAEVPAIEEPVVEEPVVEEPVVEESKPEAIEEPVAEASETVDLVEDDESAIWLLVGGGALAALLIIGGVAYYFIRKKRANDDGDEEEVLSDQDVEEISESIAEEPSSEAEEIEELNEGLDFVEEPPEEDVPVIEPEDDEPLVELDEDEPLVELEEDDEPLVELEEDEPLVEVEEDLEQAVEELAETTIAAPEEPVEELVAVEEPADVPVAEEAPVAEEVTEDPVDLQPDVEDEPMVDLSSEDLSDVVQELEEDEPEEEDQIDISADEEDLAADIAQAIEDAGDEPVEDLDKEIEEALDLGDPLDEDDDDEEFNLEDFDIGDTDDLPDDEDKKE